ncbi:MAG: hypothetical protein ACUVX8_13525 [Candidatus Zipacnadales bacterium]
MRTSAVLVLFIHSAGLGVSEELLRTDELTISRGETAAFHLGALHTKDQTILLETYARMDSPNLGGSMFFMEFALNGQVITAAKTRHVCRLLNRPLMSPVAPGLPSSWYGHGGWRVVYAPDFKIAKTQTFYADDPYRTVLDITDLVDRATDNVLTVTNTASAALAQRLGLEMRLVLGRLAIRVEPGVSPMLAPSDVHEHVINRGQKGAGPAQYKGKLLPGGGFVVTVAGKRFEFTSDFSYPKAGFHHLLPASANADPTDWQVTITAGEGQGTVHATCRQYHVTRRVRFEKRKIKIADEITNLDPQQGLGLLVRHSVNLREYPQSALRLAGNADPALNEYHSAANPSVYIALEDCALGMLCEDDVFRNQVTLFFDPEIESAGLMTKMLYLGPQERYELQWSVYPVASRDYYDFINLVREDWGANYTVEGAWCFFTPDQILGIPLEELRAALERLGVRYICSWGGWVDPKRDPKRIGFGCEVLSDYWADYRSRLREATAKLHKAKPDVKVLVYYDSERDTHSDAGTRFFDSRLTDANGTHLSTDWGGQYSLTWSMFATLENTFGKAMLEVVDAYLGEIGADGLYWDEMEHVSYGAPLITYSQLDGHSCILDPQTYTAKQQIGITTLLGAAHRAAVVQKVRAQGGFVLGNGPATTRQLLDLHVQRMVEIQHNEVWAYEGHLNSPLGYASSRLDFGNVTRALSMAMLLVGTRLDYPYDISRYLFPFTPLELHHGYLLGRERIITMHSGSYGWHGEETRCMVRIFDPEGKLREERGPLMVSDTQRMEIKLAEGEVAVIERIGD